MPDDRPPLIEVATEQDALVLTIAADQLTALKGVDEFDEQLKALRQSRPERKWVIDFRGVTFMVTPAINTLLIVMKGLRSEGGDLVLTGLERNIRHIFELMRLDEVLSITTDLPAALEALKAPKPPRA